MNADICAFNLSTSEEFRIITRRSDLRDPAVHGEPIVWADREDGRSLKKQKNVNQGDDTADKQGDCWIYIAEKQDTKLHIAHSTGKRVQDTTDKLMKKVRK